MWEQDQIICGNGNASMILTGTLQTKTISIKTGFTKVSFYLQSGRDVLVTAVSVNGIDWEVVARKFGASCITDLLKIELWNKVPR